MRNKFNKFSNDLNIKLIKGTINNTLYVKNNADNGEYLVTNLIDSNLQNKFIAFCLESPFRRISFSSYVDIEAIKIISRNK